MSIKPPKGYSKVKECAYFWIGTESMDRGWIVTPAWSSATNKHGLEVWTPKYNLLTPSEARRLAQVLLATADAVEATASAQGDQNA